MLNDIQVNNEVSAKAERHPLYQMNNNSWQKARKETGITACAHDLKHTFGK